jgi:hypothetical protein
MKNPSSYLANITGSFPNIAAQNCTGPGETDGTEIVADLVQDTQLGWIQALMNAAGLSPNGVGESSSASQILDAIKMLAYDNGNINMARGIEIITSGSGRSWCSGYGGLFPIWTSLENYGILYFPINVPKNLTIDATVNIKVKPGAARTSIYRMAVEFGNMITNITIPSTYWTSGGGPVTDDGTSNYQNIAVPISSYYTSDSADHFVKITSGNDGSTNKDTVLDLSFVWNKS